MSGEILCAERIRDLLPCRYPMMLVDRLWFESESKVVGLKNISTNEEVFNGHFPGHPIMPGVLQVEAMFQVAVIALQKHLDPSRQGDIYVKVIERVKFRRPANPGDRLLIEVDIKKIEGQTAEISAVNKNCGGVTCQANMVISVRPKAMDLKKPNLFNNADKTADIAMDVEKIKSHIPHRYPFLLVDYIRSVDGPNVVAVKNVTFNEPLMYNYPDYCVLSGAVQAEIVAQAGCVHTLARPENKGKLAYYMGIGKAEFFHPVRPGDQLRIEVVLPKADSKYGRGDGSIFVDDLLVTKADMTFALMPPPNSADDAAH